MTTRRLCAVMFSCASLGMAIAWLSAAVVLGAH